MLESKMEVYIIKLKRWRMLRNSFYWQFRWTWDIYKSLKQQIFTFVFENEFGWGNIMSYEYQFEYTASTNYENTVNMTDSWLNKVFYIQ